ncbi:TPA: helix-turn-helix transcriptional regulator [Clostridioides difficile]|nr:helix-turn-helix transcriptional regulator [Clostridioides difficile]HCQ5593594.1 helix-turn-helix transcriptional regulator [Clostridioides difficile]HCQ6314175.1 helix-turn-helix transcriptional regulator [Clostridioides difficile]HCQ6315746.1 helix-turn-helix transcriptional regulator [Clostridioides difficile]
MAVSYKKLFHMMIEKDMSNAELMQKAGFSANIITRMKRGGYISLESIESICRVMDCGVDEILDFIDDTENIEE